MKKSATSMRLTEGSISRKIIMFAIPIFLGNLFQQLYNTADSIVVGNYLGSDALAAVSSSGSLIFLMVGFFNGISLGAGVVIARYFGAQKTEELQRSIHTTIAFGVIAGILLTVIGIAFTPTILRWMGTPSDILVNSIIYFRIYFMGSIAFVLYNIFVGILQSVGDSKHPLYYLIISSIINVLLDVLFIGWFKWGVGSAALATIISQFISAMLCFAQLIRTTDVYKVYISKIKIDMDMLKQVIYNGLPTGVQNSIISFANVIVQSNINSFGKMAVAGCGSYSKIEGFAFLPIICFALSLTTFISQNIGAGEYERAKKGAIFGIICSVIIAELIGLFMYGMPEFLIGCFDKTPEVIHYGTMQIRTESLFYFVLAFSHCAAGILRGAGKAMIPMLVMLVCWCIIRVSYITIALRFFPHIRTVFWAYPITWTLSSIVFIIYLLKSNWLDAAKGCN
ncbi:MATE family efflux transporter [Asaccharospora irregularis]|uniref:Probable multidrug resistance protein NorM n=1 Tax=Asaccharospora irregularis DSM 2635 TaxID=1121321 RepID=A0A1M5TP15_9FIRM|nr:MATE family efflux transporter [Asaccharospora irregularis]SHH52376.1 putative efflux protein, MATE family [Asaccharospora irregularis DSM 2635]